MSCGFIKRLAFDGTVFSQSVNNRTFVIRTSHSLIYRGRQTVYETTPRVIPWSAGIPQGVMVSGGPSALPDNQRVSADGLALPTRAGDDTDGLFVTNAGNDRASLELLERPAGVGGIASEQKQTNQEHSVCDPAVSAYKDVFSKTAMEGPGKSVSKVEAHADKVGKFEGKGPNVGKSERSTWKVEGLGKTVGKSEEDAVGKVEQMGKSVGKSEGNSVGKAHRTEGESFGKFEGKGPNVGKSKRSTWKVEGLGKTVGESEEDAVGKVEQMSKSVGKSEGKNVGKAHRTEGESFGKFEGKGPNVGKSERSTGEVEGVGKTVGKSEEDAVGKAEQMGKSVGKSEGKNVGKAHTTEGENVGKSVGKADNESVGKLGKNNETVKVVAKVEGDVGTVTGKSVGKAAESDVGKASDKSVGRGEEDDVEKLSQRSLGHEVGKARGNIQKQTMDSKEFVIAVAGKSESEMSYVKSLTSTGELKLPEGATLVAYEQAVSREDGFRVDVYMDQLMTHQFGRLLIYARELPSTHTLLSQNCKILPVGTLSVADFQFQGKGRAGNSWESPKGCLMFSFTLQMSDGRAVPFLQYVASLAIIEAIESHCISKGLKPPEVKIKWPNDLYAKGLKVGGVLCTSTYSSKKFNIVVGVGLNVSNRQPTTCLDSLLEEINEETPGLSRDELLAAIISKFENLFHVFCSQGFFALESDYYKRWLHSGQTVILEERQEGNSEVLHVPLKIQGLTPSGYLRAVDDASEAYELHPDGNSFDFLKGLMRKKM